MLFTLFDTGEGVRNPASRRLYCGYILRSQQNPEHESVRDQQQWHEDSRNEIGGAQLPRMEAEPGTIPLVERVQKIG